MIAEVLQKELEKYQSQLDAKVAERDARINSQCDELRAQLLAEPDAEIDALQKMVDSLTTLIEKEKAEEAPVEEEIVNETPAEEIAEEIVEEPVVEETIEEAPIEEPAVKVEEIEIPAEEPKKISLFRPIEEVIDEPKEGSIFKKVETTDKPKSSRPGIMNIFNPKRS